MKCIDCPYHWQDEGEKYPSCKYPYDDINCAPCEYDDYETEDCND